MEGPEQTGWERAKTASAEGRRAARVAEADAQAIIANSLEEFSTILHELCLSQEKEWLSPEEVRALSLENAIKVQLHPSTPPRDATVDEVGRILGVRRQTVDVGGAHASFATLTTANSGWKAKPLQGPRESAWWGLISWRPDLGNVVKAV